MAAELLCRTSKVLHTILLPWERKIKLFEFTYKDSHVLNKYINEKKAYTGGVYDFTYEGRYLIYHAFIQNTTAYIVIDMKTDQASRIRRCN